MVLVFVTWELFFYKIIRERLNRKKEGNRIGTRADQNKISQIQFLSFHVILYCTTSLFMFHVKFTSRRDYIITTGVCIGEESDRDAVGEEK